MINHNIQIMSLSETDEGEISLPSESKSIVFDGNLRQFIQLTRRAYNSEALESMSESEGVKITRHQTNSEACPYFGLEIAIQSKDYSIEEFVQRHGDEFFESLLNILSFNTKPNLSGKRAVFMREFRRESNVADIISTKVLVSTSVFYNDYRVTTGYPDDVNELEDVAKNIVRRINEQWFSEVAIAVTAVPSPYEV